jgi:hypothetical protein
VPVSGRPTFRITGCDDVPEATRKRFKSVNGGDGPFDRELDQLPPHGNGEPRRGDDLRRRAGRSQTLARIIGKSCSIDLLIDDIREELRGRPYDLVAVAGGWKHLTRPAYADAIRAAVGGGEKATELTQSEVLVLMCIAYFQPITRGELSSFFGKESPILIVLRSAGDRVGPHQQPGRPTRTSRRRGSCLSSVSLAARRRLDARTPVAVKGKAAGEVWATVA